MVIQSDRRRFGIVHIFFVVMFPKLYEVKPIRNQRSTHEQGCEIWNSTLNKCYECRVGYFGLNCEKPCRYPNFGKSCQNGCDCEEKYCNSTYGCEDNAPSLSTRIPSPTVEQFSAVDSSPKEQVSANKTDCIASERTTKRFNELYYSILGLSIWTVIQFCVYLYLSFCYKSNLW
ncbi:uncharacterized protein LOC111134204 [Crassostrea virginica]